MKRNRKHNLLGWLAASTLLLTTSCAGLSDLDLESRSAGGPTTVSFTIQPQSMAGGMRAAGDLNTRNNTISEGDCIDVLIYAVYKVTTDANGKKTYDIVERYGKGDQTKGNKFTKTDGTSLLTKGQTAIDATKASYPMTLQFLMEGEDRYQVAFWAQCSETDAYDIRDLAKVEVKYTTTVDGTEANYLNNTERRDAFCAASDPISASTKTQDIILRRPLAQVNVGTTGWDYEGAAVLRPGTVSYTQSKMTLTNVAKYYNVLEGRTLTKTDLENNEEATTEVTFDYFRLPAFIQVDESEWKYPQIEPYEEEEYLQVDTNNDGNIDDYVGWEDYNGYRKDEDKKKQYGELPPTEHFKYLSMCYILVPDGPAGTEPEASQVEAAGNETEIDNGDKNNCSTVNVTFSFKGTERNDDETAGKETEFKQSFTVSNVPVQKNWRTNLLSRNGIFTCPTKFILDIVPEYCGDHNYNYGDDNWNKDNENPKFDDDNGNYYK